MADGGIHDQLGGGFHRYATDAIWLVPHFEQMLYDNAQLARVYLHAWAAHRRRRATARWRPGRLDYLLRELRRDDGAFAASQDADTERRRGRDVRLDRGRDPRGPRRRRAAPFVAPPTASRDDGNWEGRTILSRVEPAVAEDGTSTPSVEARLADGPGAAPRPACRRGRSRPATTRRSRPGTGSRSRALADAARLARSDADADAVSRRPRSRAAGRDPRRAPPARRPARSIVEGRPGDAARASSRTTPTSPTGCSPCTRRRSTSAGSSTPASSRTRSSTTSPTRPAASSTRPTTTRRSSPGRRTSRTTRRPSGGAMADDASCCGSPR